MGGNGTEREKKKTIVAFVQDWRKPPINCTLSEGVNRSRGTWLREAPLLNVMVIYEHCPNRLRPLQTSYLSKILHYRIFRL